MTLPERGRMLPYIAPENTHFRIATGFQHFLLFFAPDLLTTTFAWPPSPAMEDGKGMMMKSLVSTVYTGKGWWSSGGDCDEEKDDYDDVAAVTNGERKRDPTVGSHLRIPLKLESHLKESKEDYAECNFVKDDVGQQWRHCFTSWGFITTIWSVKTFVSVSSMPCYTIPCHAMSCFTMPWCQKKAILLYHTLPPLPCNHPIIHWSLAEHSSSDECL